MWHLYFSEYMCICSRATHGLSLIHISDCGKEIKLFGESHRDEIAKELSVPVLGQLPIDTSYAAIADKGDFYSIENDHLAKATEVLERI